MAYMTNPRCLRTLVLLGSLSLFAACSDDTAEVSKSVECASGEFYNQLNGRCELRGRDDLPGNPGDPSGDNNDPADAGAPGDSPDAGEPADGGATPPDAAADAGGHNNDSGDASSNPDPAECGPGAIIGKACAPSGAVLSGATVTLEGFDCDGQPYSVSAETNRDGEYQFDDVPAGRHSITVSIGSYSGEQAVRVRPGHTTDLSSDSKVCLDAANVRIAVIEGAYDKVEGLLADLQLSYDIKGNDQPGGSLFFPTAPAESLAFLSDLNAMQQYDIIFINCGQLWDNFQRYASGSMSTVINNLVAYLNSGRSLYASDWAHPFVETAFPGIIDFYGDDATTNSARFGFAPQTVTASVLSPGLQATLGHNTTSIHFPHTPPTVLNDHWVVAQGAGAQSTVHLHGDVQLCESTTSCSQGGAMLSDAPLLISHVTPGGGTVFFTSFHNESQGGISQDMEEILKFLIFQL